jgi:hypothetical protein
MVAGALGRDARRRGSLEFVEYGHFKLAPSALVPPGEGVVVEIS